MSLPRFEVSKLSDICRLKYDEHQKCRNDNPILNLSGYCLDYQR